MNTITCKYVEKYRDRSGNISGYLLIDIYGNQLAIKKRELKKKIRSRELKVVNLTLTKDGRLIDKAEPRMLNQAAMYNINANMYPRYPSANYSTYPRYRQDNSEEVYRHVKQGLKTAGKATWKATKVVVKTTWKVAKFTAKTAWKGIKAIGRGIKSLLTKSQ